MEPACPGPLPRGARNGSTIHIVGITPHKSLPLFAAVELDRPARLMALVRHSQAVSIDRHSVRSIAHAVGAPLFALMDRRLSVRAAGAFLDTVG